MEPSGRKRQRTSGFQRETIDLLFEALGAELARRGFQRVRLLIVGGVFMLLEVGNRPSTQDVDAIFMDLPTATQLHPPPETQLFLEAVKAVGSTFQMPPKQQQHWLNDDAALFVQDLVFGPPPPARLWKTFHDVLEVYLPSKEAILVSKLMAFREKDRRDVEALCTLLHIETREQAQLLVDRFVELKWQQEHRLNETLDDLFL